MKKLLALSAVVLCLFTQQSTAQGPAGQARIYFVDVGTGASTLVVSPTGKTLLIDGGQDGSSTKIAALLTTLGITTIDYTVVTHYHIDHISGITELINAGKVNGIAFDNGDGADVQPPGTSTSPLSTRGHYLAYRTAISNHPEVTRRTATPGTPDGVIDLGGGMRATFVAAGGRFLSGGSVQITTDDLNSESVSTLIEYNNFDYLVSGDLTGGGSTSTAKTPDVETYVAQMVGDVDVVQVDHHGSTTANNQTFLSALKAEVAFAQTGETNTFGHPNRETANKYLNTPTTTGNTFTGTGVPPATGVGPVFYQNEASPSGDDRVTLQGYTGAAAGSGGQGTILLSTDGSTTYSLSSFDDGGAHLAAAQHTYLVDGVSAGLTDDFRPTVVAQTTPTLPLATDTVTISAAVNDRESPIDSVTLAYAVNGVAHSPVAMTLSGGSYQASIPAQPNGTRVDYAITAAAGTQTSTFSSGYFSGVTAVSSIRTLNAKGEPLYTGYPARIQGTITASGFSSGTNDDYLQDVTGAVNVYRSTDTPTPFNATTPGQIAEVRGRVNFLGGRFRLDMTESLEKVSSPFGLVVLSTNPAPSPTSATIAAILADPESFEGKLVAIADAQIVSGTIPSTPQPLDAFVTISDGTGTLSLKIDHDTDVEGFTPAARFTAIGVIQQDDYLRPFDSSYNLTPRSRLDLGASAPTPPPLLTVGDARIDDVNNADGTPGADFVPDRLNQVVRVQGTVTSIDFRGGNGIEYYVQDGTGGIDLFSTSLNVGPFAIGENVEAQGTVTQFNGLTEMTVTSVSSLGTGTAPAPLVVTLAQLGDGGLGETYEGRLIRVDNVTITGGLFPALNASGNVTISDGTASGTLRVDSDTDIDGTPTPGNTFTLIGLVGQFDQVSPFDSGYQILPRALTDLVGAGGGGPALAATPGTLAFGTVNVNAVKADTVTITNNSASPIALSAAIGGANADQFLADAPAASTLAPGASTTLKVTFAPTSAGDKTASLTMTGDPTGSATVTLTGTGNAGGGGAGAIVISEFRAHGTLGGNDEFVEIYNNSDAPIDISGYRLNGSNNAGTASTRATVPNGVVLPPRAHYLFINIGTNGYSLATLGNVTYPTGITDDGGVAILPPTGTTPVDQVGMSAGSAYKEGTTLAPLTTNTNRSYERKTTAVPGTLQDGNNNGADFQLLNGSPTLPNPQNLVITAAPTTVDFGVVTPGATASFNVTIKNVLAAGPPAATITLDPAAISGADAASFSAGAPSPTSLLPGTTATIAVTFQPLTTGGKSATLTLTSSDGGSATASLSGSGAGGISVTPSPVDFGSVAPGATANATLTILNTDPTATVLTPPFAITGPDAADFAVGAPGTTTLAGSASTTVSVAFQPTTPGGKNATLEITSSSGSRSVPLTGLVNCPAITVSGSLSGASLGTLYLGTVTATGGAAPYAFTLNGGSLPTGLDLGVDGNITGMPTALGAFTFTVLATAVNGCTGSAPFTITVVQPTVITATPASLDFGVVPATTAPAPQVVTITNVTAFPVTLETPFTITGAGAANFSVGAPATTTLAGGASTTASVTFTPATAGVKNAMLSIASSGGGAATVTLVGAGSKTTPILISQFRFRGPLGGNDEFVEIYNNTDAPIDISGYRLNGSNNAGTASTRATVPAGIVLPARQHYLFVNTTAATGYSGLVPGNTGFATGVTDDGGIAILLPTPSTTIVDAVGLSAGSAYKEGTNLAPLGTTNADRGYVRKPDHSATSLQDTDENSFDFVLLAPTTPASLGIASSPSLLDFGSVELGAASTLPVALRNNFLATATVNVAPTSVTIDAPLVSGPDASSFAATAPATSTIAAGASASVGVTFTPATTGAASALLQISSTNGGSSVVSLAGTGACPQILVSGDLPIAEVGVAYRAQLTASGGTGPYSFLVSTGALPAGLMLDHSTGAVSGTPTAVGLTFFAATATSAAGCSGTSVILMITVADTTGPTLTLPAPTTTEATGATTVVSFSVTASDAGDPAPSVTCSPASGSAFPVGTTTVDCAATDVSGNTAHGVFAVTVTDHTPPALTLPDNISATATSPSGAIVNYSASATDLVDGSQPVTCSPASGSTFPIGTTTVNCSASDTRANTASGSFTVTVTTTDQPGRMVGLGTITVGSTTHVFAFDVKEGASGANAGGLQYVVTSKKSGRIQIDTFDATAITSVVFFNVPAVSPGTAPPSGIDTVTFSGSGRWNGRSGYTFAATAVDGGEPGSGRDTFAITIRNASGQIVAAVNATVTQGNIESLRLR